MFTRLSTARAGVPRLLLLTVVLVLATLLVGCGGSSGNSSSGNGVASKSAGEILAASEAAADSASSVHVIDRASQRRLVFTLNLELASDGGRGQLSLAGLHYELIRVGETLYIKGNHAFYSGLRGVLAKAAAKAPAGAWLKGPADSGPLAQFAALTDLHGELRRILGLRTPTRGLTATVNGQSVIELKQAAELYSGVLYIATTGEPYPIELVKHGRENGQTTFTGWNQPIPLSAPANAIAAE